MSEYRFTGPFYNDNEDTSYEKVTPPPAESYAEPPKAKKKSGGFGKTILKTICIALLAGIIGGGAFLGVLYLGHDVMGIGKTEETITEIPRVEAAPDIATTINNSIDVSAITVTTVN